MTKRTGAIVISAVAWVVAIFCVVYDAKAAETTLYSVTSAPTSWKYSGDYQTFLTDYSPDPTGKYPYSMTLPLKQNSTKTCTMLVYWKNGGTKFNSNAKEISFTAGVAQDVTFTWPLSGGVELCRGTTCYFGVNSAGCDVSTTASGRVSNVVANSESTDPSKDMVATFVMTDRAPPNTIPSVTMSAPATAEIGELVTLEGAFTGGVGDGLVDEMIITGDNGEALQTCQFSPATAAGSCAVNWNIPSDGDLIVGAVAYTVGLGFAADGATISVGDGLGGGYYSGSTMPSANEACNDLTVIEASCDTEWTLVNLLCSFPADFINSVVSFVTPSSCVDLQYLNSFIDELEAAAPFGDAISVIDGLGASLDAPAADSCIVAIDAPPPWESSTLTLWDCDAIIATFGEDDWKAGPRRWLSFAVVMSIGVTAFLFSRRVQRHFSA